MTLSQPTDVVTRLPIDLTQAGFAEAIAQEVERQGGDLDVLVHNAGTVVTGPIEERTSEASSIEQLINLQAPILLTEALWLALRRALGVVIGGASGHHPPGALC